MKQISPVFKCILVKFRRIGIQHNSFFDFSALLQLLSVKLQKWMRQPEALRQFSPPACVSPLTSLYFRRLAECAQTQAHLALPAQLAEKLLILKLAPLIRDHPRHLLRRFSGLPSFTSCSFLFVKNGPHRKSSAVCLTVRPSLSLSFTHFSSVCVSLSFSSLCGAMRSLLPASQIMLICSWLRLLGAPGPNGSY